MYQSNIIFKTNKLKISKLFYKRVYCVTVELLILFEKRTFYEQKMNENDNKTQSNMSLLSIGNLAFVSTYVCKNYVHNVCITIYLTVFLQAYRSCATYFIHSNGSA